MKRRPAHQKTLFKGYKLKPAHQKALLKTILKSIRVFGQRAAAVKNFINYKKASKIIINKRLLPSDKLLSQFAPAKLKAGEKFTDLKWLKIIKEEGFKKKKLNKYIYVDKTRYPKSKFLTNKVKRYCYLVFKYACAKYRKTEALKIRAKYNRLLGAKTSVLRKEMALWLTAMTLAKKMRLHMHNFRLKKNQKFREPLPGIFSLLNEKIKEDTFLIKMSQGLDALYDKENLRKKERNYSLPRINTVFNSFQVKLNSKSRFYNIPYTN